MKIETERLLLRQYALEDADEQLRIMSDPEFLRHMVPQLPTRDKVLVGFGRISEHWLRLGYGQWAMELRRRGGSSATAGCGTSCRPTRSSCSTAATAPTGGAGW